MCKNITLFRVSALETIPACPLILPNTKSPPILYLPYSSHFLFVCYLPAVPVLYITMAMFKITH
jgi:hypothetical protein